MSSSGISWIPLTPTVFCAVIAVIHDVPKTPRAEKVFKSACIPAPPPESDPAIVIALGIVRLLLVVMSSPCNTYQKISLQIVGR